MSASPRWNDRHLAGGGEWHEDALLGIERLVADQRVGPQARQEMIGADKIVRLTSGEEEAYGAERIGQGMDLGAQPAPRSADGLIHLGFFVRRHYADESARWCSESWRIRCQRPR